MRPIKTNEADVFRGTPQTLLSLLFSPTNCGCHSLTSSLVSIYGAAADMTVNVHDAGLGGGGYDDEGTASTCGDGVGGDRGDGEPYVVFGYGSLIFRVRLLPSIHRANNE